MYTQVVQTIANLQDQIQQLQGQAHQFLFERGDHLQQILDLLSGQQGLQAQLDDRDAERLVHLEHIQDLQEQVGDLELDIQALEGVVVMLQQVHHPPAIGDDEQMEI
jgi:chromosome segregation ATPase